MTNFEQRMAELRGRFAARTDGELRRLIGAIDRRDAEAIGSIAHRLAGNAGVFGFHQLGDAAKEVEDALDGRAPADELERSCRTLAAQLGTLDARSPR